jgi:hypothetical protein
MHCVRAAAARAFCTAGTSSAIKMAMIAITTSTSINVNARLDWLMTGLLGAKRVAGEKRLLPRAESITLGDPMNDVGQESNDDGQVGAPKETAIASRAPTIA